jgi:hypothetical protein
MSVTAEEIVTAELVPYASSGAVEEYRPRIVLSADEAQEMDIQLRATMLAVLREDVDYGVIPGAGTKKNLLKPGAEKLLQWFGFGSRSAEVKIERDDPDSPSGIADKVRRVGVTYRTEITKTVPGAGTVVVATCEGYAGYDEDRYYVSAEDAVAKAEAKERFWASKDSRAPNPAKWQNAAEYRAPWNTLIKMAAKRAYVGATIDATAAAGLFTQDMEDIVAEKTAPAALIHAARAEIDALPQAAKTELDAWTRALRWPGTAQWDTSQWCKALVKGGQFAAAASQPQKAARAPEAAEDIPPGGEDGDAAWTAQSLADAATFATAKDGEKLWAEVVTRHAGGRMDDRDRETISRLMKDRLAELRQPAGQAA